MQLLLTLEKSIPRLEDTVKRYSVLGKLPPDSDYMQMIDGVTTEQVRKVAERVIRTNPSLVVLGGDTHAIPSADIFHKYLA